MTQPESRQVMNSKVRPTISGYKMNAFSSQSESTLLSSAQAFGWHLEADRLKADLGKNVLQLVAAHPPMTQSQFLTHCEA